VKRGTFIIGTILIAAGFGLSTVAGSPLMGVFDYLCVMSVLLFVLGIFLCLVAIIGENR
jgi:hypothetical protein